MRGIKRKVDQLGRVVIPCELREEYKMFNESIVEIIPTREGILIKSSEFEDTQMKNAISIINMEIEKARDNPTLLLGLTLAKQSLVGEL